MNENLPDKFELPRDAFELPTLLLDVASPCALDGVDNFVGRPDQSKSVPLVKRDGHKRARWRYIAASIDQGILVHCAF